MEDGRMEDGRMEDGRMVVTPVAWYPRLVFATPEELHNFRIMPGGDGLHWPDLDEHLSVRGMLLGPIPFK